MGFSEPSMTKLCFLKPFFTLFKLFSLISSVVISLDLTYGRKALTTQANTVDCISIVIAVVSFNAEGLTILVFDSALLSGVY